MCAFRRLPISLCLLLCGLLQAQGFVDTFESTTLDPFWIPLTTNGSIVPDFGGTVYCGAGAAKLVTNGPPGNGVNQGATLFHAFAGGAYGRLSVWMYDVNGSASSSNYVNLWCPPFGIGIRDYNTGTFDVTTPGGSFSAPVVRSTGWHHLVVEATPTTESVSIDGVLVHTGPGGQPFLEAQLEMHAPAWRPAWVSYFDDFSWTPWSPGTGSCGQANTPCASLLVNGLGASGCGPFLVCAQSGAPLTLNWSGPANQPFLLAGAPAMATGQNLGSGIVIDLQLATTTVLFGGLDPISRLLFSTGNDGNGYGSAAQTINVPPSAAGSVLGIQGAVFDLNGLCPANPGYMTTASFVLSFS